MIDLPSDGAESVSEQHPSAVESSAPKTLERPKPGGILEREIDQFIRHVSSLNDTLPLAMLAIRAGSKVANDKYEAFLKDHCEVEKGDKSTLIRFDAELQEDFNRVRNRHERARLAFALVPRSLIVALVSQYDAFIGALVRVYYLIHAKALNTSERSLTLAQLAEFGSIEAAQEFILEKEVESVLRKSHVEQFDWMEERFDLQLRKGLESWPTFVELTERRNLFVHTSGTVSSQYMVVCQRNGVKCDSKLRPGHRLSVSPAYFEGAFECVFEIGVKLAHVFWRKMLPDDRENADNHLNTITYELIGDGQFRLASALLDFAALTLKKYSSEYSRRVFIINRAQAYKWLGDNEKAIAIIDKEDWSASSDDFRIAELVIRDDFSGAANLMRKIGTSGEVSRTDYANWPVFREFRRSDAFGSAFQEIFGQPFSGRAAARTSSASGETSAPVEPAVEPAVEGAERAEPSSDAKSDSAPQ